MELLPRKANNFSQRKKKLIFGFDIRKKIKQFMDISAKVEAIAIRSMK